MHGVPVNVIELDIQRDKKCDFTRQMVQKEWLQRIDQGEFHAVILTPPCSTYSRASWANDRGPYTLRSRRYPRGFPWNSFTRKQKAQLGTVLAEFSFEAFKRQLRHGEVVMEQPEDLGKTKEEKIPGDCPASMWQMPQFAALLQQPGVRTVVFPQLSFGTASVKPTRFLMKLQGDLHQAMYEGPPQFDSSWRYTGPLPPMSGEPLIGRDQHGFKTAQAAAWPPALCEWVASKIFTSYLQVREKGEDHLFDRSIEVDELEGGGFSGGSAQVTGSSSSKLREGGHQAAKKQEEAPVDPTYPPFPGGKGPARQCVWKGMHTPFHDGGGLASPGRWPRELRRYPHSSRWDSLRSEVERVCRRHASCLGGLEREAFRMAKGGESFSLVKNDAMLDELRAVMVATMGMSKEELVVAEGQPFRLRLMSKLLEEAGDCDYGFLRRAEDGLPVGVLEQLPRTPGIFERQEKWNLEEVDQGDAAFVKANYPSAEDHEGHLIPFGG